MREVIDDIDRWLSEGDAAQIGLATVVETWGSAPRRAGAKLAFTASGRVAGSVSGGCVEAAVLEAGRDVLTSGTPRLLHFSVADETAWDVGLACGGTIDVYVEPLDIEAYRLVRAWISSGSTAALATVLQGPEGLAGQKLASTGALRDADPQELSAILPLLAAVTHTGRKQLDDGIDVLVEVYRPAPQLVMVGGAHIAVALARLARVTGHQTAVIDPRRVFGAAERFPDVDRLLHAWPDKAFEEVALSPGTALVTLSHDPKIDDPALAAALRSDAFYIGALGSRRTHRLRLERLSRLGFTAEELDRIHAPIGLDIGAENPEEIAVAVLAEVIKAYRGQAPQTDPVSGSAG